jgi:hypothetical protein
VGKAYPGDRDPPPQNSSDEEFEAALEGAQQTGSTVVLCGAMPENRHGLLGKFDLTVWTMN